MDAIELRPQAGPQEDFLSSPADIVIYGGGAGGGKTWALLIEPLRHINNSDFRFVIFRRSYPQIINPGGLQDEALALYPYLGGKDTQPSSGITWKFPSGASGRFAHMQHDKNRKDWQGSQIPLIGFDELTHFTADQFWYMLSRNRSTCGVRPYIRATTNPEPGWVADLIAWWIDDDGYARADRAGVIRWFIRDGGALVWADSKEDLQDAYPERDPNTIKSLTFIPALLGDNQILMEKDPGYLANLMALPLVERERLLRGNWKIQPAGGKVFNRAWFRVMPPQMIPAEGFECRFWDFAATEKQSKGDDPDYTASVKIRVVGDTYYVMDCIAVQSGPAEVERLFVTTSRLDAKQAARAGIPYGVRWEIEPGSASKRENQRLIKLLDGLDAKGVRSTGDKLTRAKPLAVQSEAGYVVLAEGQWNERWLTHMHHQPDWAHDDIMDASSGAHQALAPTYGTLIYPTFSADNVAEIAEYNPAHGPVYWGIVDGYTQGQGPGNADYQPRVVVLGQVTGQGQLHIFAEYFKCLVADHKQTIGEVLAYGYPEPEMIYLDPSQKMLRTALTHAGLYNMGTPHDVDEGIKNVRRLIVDANGHYSLLIHPRCEQLIREIETYQFDQDSAHDNKPVEIDNRGPDALRQLCWGRLRIQQG